MRESRLQPGSGQTPVPAGVPRPRQRRRDGFGLAAIALLGLVLLDTLVSSTGAERIWIGVASVTWLALAVVALGRWRSRRGRVWLVALVSPLCLLGPILALALINGRLRASLRRDLRDTRTGLRSDPSTRRLIAGLIGSIFLGVVVFLGIATLAAIAGGDHNGYLYPRSFRVIVWIGAATAMIAIVVVALWWLVRGSLHASRVGLVGALAAAALVVVGGTAVWLGGQTGPDPRPTNTVPPSVSGIPRVGETLAADHGTWRWPTDVPRPKGASRFSYSWERCEKLALRCVRIEGATQARHVLVSDDAGYRLRVTVSAENDAGFRDAHSRPTKTTVGR